VLSDDIHVKLRRCQENINVQYHNCSLAGCQRVIINVSGHRFETQLRTLNRFPNTLLGNHAHRKQFWDARRNEFFIDRHRASFQAVLYYYQSGGRLLRPLEVADEIFLDELAFYRISDDSIIDYKLRQGYILDKIMQLPNVKWMKVMWLLFEEPDSSRAAKVVAILSVIFIMVSITNFCMETLPTFDRQICRNVSADGDLTFRIQPNYRFLYYVRPVFIF